MTTTIGTRFGDNLCDQCGEPATTIFLVKGPRFWFVRTSCLNDEEVFRPRGTEEFKEFPIAK